MRARKAGFDPDQPPDGYGQWTDAGRTQEDQQANTVMAAGSNRHDATPIPFLDSSGDPVIGVDGMPMLRPLGLDPEILAARGEYVKPLMVPAEGDHDSATGAGGIGLLMSDLAKFQHNGEWDAQRFTGTFDKPLRDFSTVAIGIYSASAGVSLPDILTIQNAYAGVFSRFASSDTKDEVYTNLPRQNVLNTTLGYKLVETGRIRPGRGI